MCLMQPASLPFFISGLRHVEMHRRLLLLGGVVVQYRGYTIEVSRETSGWRAGVYPRSPDLPIVHRSDIYCDDQDAPGD